MGTFLKCGGNGVSKTAELNLLNTPIRPNGLLL